MREARPSAESVDGLGLRFAPNRVYRDGHERRDVVAYKQDTLCHRSGGLWIYHKSHEACQAPTSAIENVLETWALQLGAQAFPRRLDISKVMAEKLTQGRQWFKSYLLQGFLNPVIGGGEAAGEGMFTKPTHHELLLDHDGASVCMSFI